MSLWKRSVRQSAPALVSSITSVAPNGKSKLAAALFALFLGGSGIHKFYLGDVSATKQINEGFYPCNLFFESQNIS
jgi:hypothetical protein